MRRRFRMKGERVSFVRFVIVKSRNDMVLVRLAGLKFGNECLPDSGLAARFHRVAVQIPVVEVANHRDRLRIRRPDCEVHAEYSVDGVTMRAQMTVKPDVAAFVE